MACVLFPLALASGRGSSGRYGSPRPASRPEDAVFVGLAAHGAQTPAHCTPSSLRYPPRRKTVTFALKQSGPLAPVPAHGGYVAPPRRSRRPGDAPNASTVSQNPRGDLPTSSDLMDATTVLRQNVHRLAAAVIVTAGGEETRGACRAVAASLGVSQPQPQVGAAEKSPMGLLPAGGSEPKSYLDDAAVLLYSVASLDGGMLVAEGGLQALTDIIRAPGGDAATSTCRGYAVAALSLLFSSQPQAASAFISAGGIPLLVRVFAGLPEDDHDARGAVLDAVLRLMSGRRRAVAAVAAAESGLVPILLELMSKSNEERLVAVASDILDGLVSVKQCSEQMLRQRVVDQLVWLIQNRRRDVGARCKAITVLQQFARSRDASIKKIIAVNSSKCLVQVLWHGIPEEVVAAERAVLEIGLAPIGAQYMYRAGLVPAICATFVAADSVDDTHRAIRLIQCVAKSPDAIEDLMQPAVMEAFAECLKNGREDTQCLVCSTLLLLLRQCPAPMASRSQRLVPMLVTVLRTSSSTPSCRAAVFCLLRLCQEPSLTELMLASGMLSAVDKLLSDPEDLEPCRWGLLLAQQLSSRSRRAGRFFAQKAGLLRKMAVLLDTSLDLQAVSTLSALAGFRCAVEELVDVNAQETVASIIANKGRSSPRAGDDRYRGIFLASELLARLLAHPDSRAVTPQLAAKCIPNLVEALAHPIPTIPLYVSDMAPLRDGHSKPSRLLNGPNRVLILMAVENHEHKRLLLEEMSFRVWTGHTSVVHGIDLI